MFYVETRLKAKKPAPARATTTTQAAA
jgi:hypothetical protein